MLTVLEWFVYTLKTSFFTVTIRDTMRFANVITIIICIYYMLILLVSYAINRYISMTYILLIRIDMSISHSIVINYKSKLLE